MKIGRKLYYEMATGNVLVDTGERSGDVIETTTEQDFTSYTALQGRVPETVGVVQLEYGQFAEEISRYSIRIDPATGEILWGAPHNTGLTLEDVKAAKIAQLVEFRDRAITSPFESKALGEVNIYPADETAQKDLQIVLQRLAIAEKQMMVAGAKVTVDNRPTFDYLTLDAGYLPHTLDQLEQVFADGVDAATPWLIRFRELKAMVEAAQTVEETNAVQWDQTVQM